MTDLCSCETPQPVPGSRPVQCKACGLTMTEDRWCHTHEAEWGRDAPWCRMAYRPELLGRPCRVATDVAPIVEAATIVPWELFL